MKFFLIVVFMTIIGAIIGGVTNMIAIKMLFHPFKPYYIFGKRIPFTPGLVPKRREEIATKIGDVVETHLLTEALIREKLSSQTMKDTIQEAVQQQVNALQDDDITVQRIFKPFDIDVVNKGESWLKKVLIARLTHQYSEIASKRFKDILPLSLMEMLDHKVAQLDSQLLIKARKYIASDKGYRDIYEMLDAFFHEKSRILSVLLMFMTKDDLAARIQSELLRLTNHPKAQHIIKTQIVSEYESFKSLKVKDVITLAQFESHRNGFVNGLIRKLNLSKHSQQPLKELAPELMQYLMHEGSAKVTELIIYSIAQRLTRILKKVNISGMVEEQINRFDLDYIEQLIFDIANKELKLIMLLGFILGGMIGFFQGLVAIFV
ncbi:DUF445 family protein [Staphylococcus agnetis]|uniref:DUF445 domain-containing protein n=1 Tax=Staphylococcus agnetis TaxID=985762 RepID=UPI0021D0757A|nr:DUF445 family protein [Staphylococcus agnetis]UXU65074.1 DUF445 family protein [Staphylococcus agnetis]UXU67415.1 DUF445 family protein [Staphylococcus agnetis]